MELIPAIDLIDGRCVRLTQGDYDIKKVYEQNPVDMAKMYADCGVRRLHVVDLDGAKAKEPCNLRGFVLSYKKQDGRNRYEHS